jgi:hypothetical protein
MPAVADDPCLRLLLLRERKLGHANQVEGLALAIGRMTKVCPDRLEVRRKPLPGKLLQRRIMTRLPDRGYRWLRAFYGIDLEKQPKPDVILGSGDVTIGVGILARRLTGAKFILAGDPKDYDTREIDLVIVHSPRVAGEPNCVFAPIPCTVDPDLLPAPRPLRQLADLAGAQISLLIGGHAGGYQYSDEEWKALSRLVVATGNTYGHRWAVSNSRRTPDLVTDIFARLAASGQIERFVDFREAGPGSLASLYAADAVVVTEDSRSMMAEAMASRRPVILMRPKTVAYSLGTERVAATVAGGGAAVLPIATATAEQFAHALVTMQPARSDPREALAAAIAPVLGLNPRAKRLGREMPRVPSPAECV